MRYPEITTFDGSLPVMLSALEGDDEMTGRFWEDVEYVRGADGVPSSESDDVTLYICEK